MMSQSKKNNKYIINSIIGLAIMLLFPLIPLGDTVITEVGQKVIGVFLGTIFLWSTGNTIWSSLLAVVMLAFYGFKPMNEVVAEWMGNSTLIMIFFLLILVGAFAYHKCTLYVARFFLSLKILEGRPWVFTFIVLLGTYFMGTFVNPWAGVFLFLPIIHNICDELGFKKTDKYPQMMTITVVGAALLGFPSAFYNGSVLALTRNFTEISGGTVQIPGAQYMMVTLPLGVLSLIGITLAMRFIQKVNVEPLKDITVEKLNKNPLPPINLTQKIVSLGVLTFILLFLVPSLLPNIEIMKVLKSHQSGIAMTIVAILAAIHVEGKPVLDLPKVMANNFSWQTYLLCGSAIYLGSVLSDKSVGFNLWLQNLLGPVLMGMGTVTFTIVLILLTVAITNVFNSFVLVILLQPIVWTYVELTGVEALPMVVLLIFASLGTALITPSASPYAASIFAQKDYVKPSDIYKNAPIYAAIVTLVVLVVGIPLSFAVLG